MPIQQIFEGKINNMQIIDKDGNVDELLDPKLPKDLLLKMYIYMVLTRTFDQKCMNLQRQGRVLTYAPSLGQEAAQIGSVATLEDKDWIFPSYREHATYLWRGIEMSQLMTYWIGSELGMKIPEGKNNFLVSIPIASQALHAVGAAWAAKLRGDKVVTIGYFGDGATSEGEFHEAMNFAGVYQAPCVLFCQNNQWAISTARKKQTATTSIAQKALAYGVKGIQVDGNDVLAVYKATKEAVDNARNGGGPTLIEAVTFRRGPHTTADDPTKYRKEDEVKYWEERDPIRRFTVYLKKANYLNDELEKKILDRSVEEVEKAILEAEATKMDNPEDMFNYAFGTMPVYLQEQKNELMEYLRSKKV
ncbi:MAG: pyruvate dehydrogenase (acetyl-transferring) E1 component subunit alpha [Candidatus Micrarchaeota archaeon]|nr:pyruvate dehydrogenase (acetyl-transferring) E1 component subunit alpha [Candidatus Micrarchaeota archaeon]